MENSKRSFNRRGFIKTAGLTTLAGGIISKSSFAEEALGDANTPVSQKVDKQQSNMPMRKLGKCDVKVPVLSQGAMYDVINNQISIAATLRKGINYLDTAHSYSGGKSEIGIGNFFEKNPEKRKDVFLVTKASGARTPEQIEQKLQTSLKRMNTDYIDLYYGVHALSSPDQLTDELKQWAKSAKKRGLIKYFGFSTHKNMADCLEAAAKLDWIDAIMTSYNFRLLQDSSMQKAVENCHKKGIGLIAMKVMARGQDIDPEKDGQLSKYFLSKGLTQPQAKIKIVLQDKRISSACIRMPNISQINENLSAVMDNQPLTKFDRAILSEFASATCSGYCAGCASLCDSAVPDTPYISETMRYLMYHDSYGDKTTAKELFRQIPDDIKNKLADADFSQAESICPNNLKINKLMKRAFKKLS
jgi:hypothetical protein